MTTGMHLANQLEDMGYHVIALDDNATELLIRMADKAFIITIHDTVPPHLMERLAKSL